MSDEFVVPPPPEEGRGDEVLLVKEVCVMLRCSKTKVYDLFEAGKLQGFRLGSGVRIYRDSVGRYKEGNANRPPLTPRPTLPAQPRKKSPPLHPPLIGGYGHGL
jgi:excisionase family DNA binding protein